MLPRVVLAGGLLVSMTGCLALQGQVPVHVPLNPPEPPSRVVMPPPEPIVEDTPTPVVSPPAAAVTTPAKPPAQATPPARPPDRTEPPVRIITSPPTDPPQVLQPTADTTDLQKRIQRQIDSATSDLNKVDRKTLPAAAREQFDQARSFLRQAQEFVAIKFYSYADQLSDKACRLARELAK